MRKIGNILLIIAGIFTIIGSLGCLGGSIAMFVFAGPQYTNAIAEAFANGTIHTTLPGTPEQAAAMFQSMLFAFAIVLAIEVLVAIGCAVVAFLANSKQTSGLYIANIVLGVLNGSLFSVLGGIFGLVGKEDKSL